MGTHVRTLPSSSFEGREVDGQERGERWGGTRVRRRGRRWSVFSPAVPRARNPTSSATVETVRHGRANAERTREVRSRPSRRRLRTRSYMRIRPSVFSTVPVILKQWSKRLCVWAWKRLRSPTTTASTELSGLPKQPKRSASRPCSALSCRWERPDPGQANWIRTARICSCSRVGRRGTDGSRARSRQRIWRAA